MKQKNAFTKCIYHIGLYIFLMLFGVNTIVKAGPVDEETAKAVALTQLKKVGKGITLRSSASLEIADKAVLDNGKVAYYIVNSNDGFIIVSGDDRISPILGYSTGGSSFDPENIPLAMQFFLGEYKNEIDYIISNDLKLSDNLVKKKWHELRNGEIITEVKSENKKNQREIGKDINLRSDNLGFDPEPYVKGENLIKTKWNQYFPYNAECPPLSVGSGRSLVGCVATAMAQILRYWENPITGYGEYSYAHSTGNLYADFGNTNYQYEYMPSIVTNDSSAQKRNAVSLLLFHVGVSIGTNYGGSSSAYMFHWNPSYANSYDAFRNFWGYKDVKYIDKQYVTESEWLALLKSQIDKKYPVLYEVPNHAIICDGYNSDNLIHIIWGWGDSYDGFYLLTNMIVNGNNYTTNQKLLIDIYYTGQDFEMPVRLNNSSLENPAHDMQAYTNEILLNANLNPCDSGQVDNIFWHLKDSILTISGIGKIRDYTSADLISNTPPWFSYGSFIKKVVILDGITAIGDRAFESMNKGIWAKLTYKNLQSIEIPNSVTVIGDNSFEYCSNLKNLKMSDSLIIIGDRAFFNCENLTSIIIPNGVTSIGDRVFANCNNLASIKIPKTVTFIGDFAFQNNNIKKDLDVYWEYPLSCNIIFGNTANSTLIVPAGTKALYEAASVWKDFGTIIEREVNIPVTSISLTPKSATLVVGSYLQNIAIISPDSATDKSITWTSSNAAVATVDSLGKVVAIASGNAIITATTNDGNKSATIEVKVIEVEVLSVSLKKSSSVLIGDTIHLIPSINPSYASNKTLTWSSNNELIATVDATGKVTGISKGTAIIKVTTNNGKKAYCVVLVTESQFINYASVVIPITESDDFIIFSIERPAGSDESNVFAMGFPDGLSVYSEDILFAESLLEGLNFTVIPLGNNIWLFEISAQPIAPFSYLLRSALNKQITNIICEITGGMAEMYEVVLRDGDLNDETEIPKFELTLKVGETKNDQVKKDNVRVLFENDILSVDTPYSETIKVYNISGSLVYTVTKDKGRNSYPTYNIPNGIYIVTGSNGWFAKVLKK